MSTAIYDGITLVCEERDGEIVPADSPQGVKVAFWLVAGVPGLRGRIDGDLIHDETSVVPPKDPLFGLALLEHFEELGWEARPIASKAHRIALDAAWRLKAGFLARKTSTGPEAVLGEAGGHDEALVEEPDFTDEDEELIERVWRELYPEGGKAFCPTGAGGGVDNSCGPGGGSVAPKPIDATGKNVKYSKLEPTKHAAIEKALGENWQPKLAKLFCGEGGATIDLDVIEHGRGVTVVTGTTKGAKHIAWRKLYFPEDGTTKPWMENIGFKVYDVGGRGLGRELFKQQVEQAKAMGVSRIKVSASGKPNDTEGKENGYYTWARFGFDAPLKNIHDSSVKAKAEKQFPGAKRISDIMSAPAGAKWWREHGSHWSGEFDLTDDSHSLKVWNAYLKEKGSSTKSIDFNTLYGLKLKAFCATGTGGGVDNSCSPTGGGGQTETPAFKAWFKNSKVVTPEGKPMPVYHGTNGKFEDEFDVSRGELGIHFGTKEVANSFGDRPSTSGGNRVYKCFLSIQNPLRMVDKGDWNELQIAQTMVDAGHMTEGERDAWKAGFDARWKEHFAHSGLSYPRQKEAQDLLESKGFDGIVYVNRREGMTLPTDLWENSSKLNALSDEEFLARVPDATTSWIAIRPEQIKSATGNNGEFDPSSPNINKAFCPTGEGGGIDNSCSPHEGGGGFVKPAPAKGHGEAGKIAGVDTSKWGTHHSSAKIAAKKISQMEALFQAGDMQSLLDMPAKYSEKMNSYQKAVIKAKSNLLDMASHKGLGGMSSAPEEDAVPETSPVPQPTTSVPWKAPDAGMAVDAHGVTDISSWKKTGSQLGSNPGGVYEAPDGSKWYVKQHGKEAWARQEVLGSKLLQAAGGNSIDYRLVNQDGKFGTATKWIDGLKQPDWNDASIKELAQKDFAAHAWLANHDVVGTGGPSNLQVFSGPAGAQIMSTDMGGSLEYRAQGEMKPSLAFAPTVSQWSTLRDEKVNSFAAKVFGDMTNDQLSASAAKVTNVSSEQIKALVGKYSGLDGAAADAFAQKLIARRDNIAMKASALITSKEVAASLASFSAQAKQDPSVAAALASTPDAAIQADIAQQQEELKAEAEKLTESNADAADKAAKEAPPPALPAPPTITSAANQGMQKKLNALYEAAKTGNVSKVQEIKTNGESKQTYTKMVHQYKLSLLDSMGHGAVVSPAKEQAAHVAKVAESKQAIKIDPQQFPETPEFLSSKQEFVTANKVYVSEALLHATAGDLEALKAMPASASPKAAAFHAELMQNLAEQLSGKKPAPVAGMVKAPTTEATLAEISNKFKLVKGAGKLHSETGKGKDMGYWNLVGNAEGIPVDSPVSPGFKKIPAQWLLGLGQYTTLTEDQKKAIYDYTISGHHAQNASLRFKDKPTADAVATATAIAEKGVDVPPGMVLSRKYFYKDEDGNSDAAALQKHFNALQEHLGYVMYDKGMLSTGHDPKSWTGNVQFQITAAKGMRGFPVDKFSGNKGESEYVLGPRQRLLVTGVRKLKAGNSDMDMENGSIVVEAIGLPWDDGQMAGIN